MCENVQSSDIDVIKIHIIYIYKISYKHVSHVSSIQVLHRECLYTER